MSELTGILQEYVATANNPEYKVDNKIDWNVINSKFTKEFKEVTCR